MWTRQINLMKKYRNLKLLKISLSIKDQDNVLTLTVIKFKDKHQSKTHVNDKIRSRLCIINDTVFTQHISLQAR